MKQRHHRKAVQRRMREAPTQYDRDCAFYDGHRWKKRDSKKILRRPLKPLEFNRIHMIGPDTLTHRTIGPSDVPGHVTVVDHHAIRPYQQAITDALVTGTGWALVDGTLEGRAASRAEFMRNLTDAAIFEALKAR